MSKKNFDISKVSDKTLKALIAFARKRGYVLNEVYTTPGPSNKFNPSYTHIRAKLTHWSGLNRRAWFGTNQRWRWE